MECNKVTETLRQDISHTPVETVKTVSIMRRVINDILKNSSKDLMRRVRVIPARDIQLMTNKCLLSIKKLLRTEEL